MKTPITPLCRRLLLLLLAGFVLLAPAPGHGHERPGAAVHTHPAPAPYEMRLRALLDAAVRAGLPGVSLRVKGPGIDFQGAAGVADLETGEPLTASHVMYVASLGKTFTAVVALQLCAEGRLDLDAPITTWLPVAATRHIPASGTITLRHLLGHTSGLRDYLNDAGAWWGDFARQPHRRWTHSEVVPYLYDKPLLFAPGSHYHYSNSNYILVGWILERVTAQPLHVLIRSRILAPLGLESTFNGEETPGSVKRAHGYVRRHGRIIDTYPWYGHYGLADSGMHSTAGDLALFLESLFTTEVILSQAMRTEMTTVPESVQPPSHYGLGIFVQRNPGGAGHWYANNGVDPGYHADMMYLPDLDLTVVLAANASEGKADSVYARLLSAVYCLALEAVRENRRGAVGTHRSAILFP